MKIIYNTLNLLIFFGDIMFNGFREALKYTRDYTENNIDINTLVLQC